MDCEEQHKMFTKATPLSLLPQDRTTLSASPNASQFSERLVPFGYPTNEFSIDTLQLPPASPQDPSIVADKAWGYCAWITQVLRLSAGFELLCLLAFCCVFAAVWWICVERTRRLASTKRKRSESKEPLVELEKLKDCCGKRKNKSNNEHKSDQPSTVQASEN